MDRRLVKSIKEISINQLMQYIAKKYGNSRFLTFEDENWTHLDFYRNVLTLAKSFQSEDYYQKSRNIALLMNNRPEFLFLLLSFLSLGRRVVLINTALAPPEINYILGDAEVEALFIDPNLYEKNQSMLQKWNKKVVHVTKNWFKHKISDTTLVDGGYNIPDTKQGKIIIYTSGTTGKPKGVQLSQKSIISEAVLFAKTMNYSMDFKEKHLCFLPLYHVFSLFVSFFANYVSGGEVYLLPKFTQRLWEKISEYKITSFAAVPTVFNILIQQDDPEVDISSLEYAISGGDSLTESTLIEYQNRFCDIREGYGLSEATCATSVNPRYGPIKIGSVGKALDGIKLAIIDENKKFLPKNRVGTLCISGPIVMEEYYNNKEATRQVIFEKDSCEWLITGDLATIDEDGYIFLNGRSSELIISKGENIYPKEIERILDKTKWIKESAVIGFAHHIYGEVPVAFIVPRRQEKLDLSSIRELLQENLAEFKIPHYFIPIDQLPRNSLGKVQKHKLEEVFSVLLKKYKNNFSRSNLKEWKIFSIGDFLRRS